MVAKVNHHRPLAINDNTPPSWLAKRSLSKRDLAIKTIGVTALALLSTATMITSFVTSFGIVGGFALGSAAVGLAGAGLGALPYIFKKKLDLVQYHNPAIADQICEDLKTESFRDIAKAYNLKSLRRYGFITRQAEESMKLIKLQMKTLDRADRKWERAHAKEIRLYKKDSNNPKFENIRKRIEAANLKEQMIQQKWENLRDKLILPVLPQKEIEAFEKQKEERAARRFA